MRLLRVGPRVAAVVAVGALLAAGCGDSGGGGGGGATGTTAATGATGAAKQGGTFRLGISEPTSIDPYNSRDSESEIVTKNVFSGLLVLDNDTLELKPGVAEKWSRTDDCKEWTFNLRKGTKFTNGEEVTTKSFIDAWNRAVQQKAASDVASFLDSVEGYDAVHGATDAAGKPVPATAQTMSGLSAADAYTLKVKTSGDCEFDKKTIHPVFSPVPSVAGAFDNKTYNDMPIGNGPFKMEGAWQHDKSITLVRNPDYYGTKANLDRVEFTIEKIADEYKGFQAGQRDYARIPTELVAQAKATYEKQGSFITEVKFGINYLTVLVNAAPLNNADARKAVSAAIDRQAVIDGVFKVPLVKADSLIPPVFKTFYKEGQCDACVFNVTKAKEFAQKGGLTPGTKITFSYNEDGGHKPWVEAVADQLKTNLGLVVDIVPVPKFRDELNKMKEAGANGIYRTAWGADYASPINFLEPLVKTGAGQNYGKYSNTAVDDQINKAIQAKDDAARLPFVTQAQKLAIADDMALIPLWYRTQFRVFDSSKFKGVRMDFFEHPTLTEISLK